MLMLAKNDPKKSHYLLTLKLFQTCTSFFLADTKEDILKNVGDHAVTFPHTMEVNGLW